METVTYFLFLGSKITVDSDCSHEIKTRLPLGRKSYDKPRWHIKKQRHYFANKGPSSQSYGFSSSHVWMWELDYKKKAERRRIDTLNVMLGKTLESLFNYSSSSTNYSWTTRRSNQSILKKSVLNIHWKDLCWSSSSNTLATWCEELTHWKRPWFWERQEEKGVTEDEMVGWHHQFNGHEFEQAPRVGDGQGSLACCSPWGCKELDTTEQLKWLTD